MKKDYIKKERLIKEFFCLTEIDSESFYEREMADYLKKALANLEIYVNEDDAAKTLRRVCRRILRLEGKTSGNLWTCMPGNLKNQKENQDKAILLCAHMDTVSPGQGKKRCYIRTARLLRTEQRY